MTNLRDRYLSETNSALKLRYITESQLTEATDPAAATEALVASQQQLNKIKAFLSAVPNGQLTTLKTVVSKAGANITNPKFSSSCTALLASLESLFGYMGKLLATFEDAKDKPDESLETALSGGEDGQPGTESPVSKAAQKIIVDSLSPNGKIASWLNNKLGKSFLTTADAQKIAKEFLQLTYKQFEDLKTKGAPIATAAAATAAARAASKTNAPSTQQNVAGQPANGAPAQSAATPDAALKALEAAGINLKGMPEGDRAKFITALNALAKQQA
jgi:hypothetical protein